MLLGAKRTFLRDYRKSFLVKRLQSGWALGPLLSHLVDSRYVLLRNIDRGIFLNKLFLSPYAGNFHNPSTYSHDDCFCNHYDYLLKMLNLFRQVTLIPQLKDIDNYYP